MIAAKLAHEYKKTHTCELKEKEVNSCSKIFCKAILARQTDKNIKL